jgi:YaiO family outer membrane protein
MLQALIVALAIGAGVEQDTAATHRQNAERLARDGRHRDAIAEFQQVLAREPRDVESRIWVARLWRRLGRTDLSEYEYTRALAQSPDHVDALVGLSMALGSRGATSEAAQLLDRAERLAPDSSDVLAARAFVSRMAGQSSAAESYYARVVALTPSDPDIRLAFEQTRRLNRHRLEGSFQHETLDGAGSAHGADAALDVRRNDRMRFNFRLQAQNRASRSEARAGGGVEWRARPDLTVRGTALLGPGADVIARIDAAGELEHSRGRWELGGGIRAVSFAAADVWMVSPGATYWVNDRSALTARYYASWTRFSQRSPNLTHSAMGRFRYAFGPRFWLDAAYSRGYESIDTLSIDRLASLRADTVSTGLMYHLRGLQSLAAGIDYQRRSDDRTMVRLTLTAVHRF